MPVETITTIDESEGLARAGFRWRVGRGGMRALACAPLERDGFTNAFSTRAGGVSPMPHGNDLNLAGFDDDAAENIYENRRRFLLLLEDEEPARQNDGDGKNESDGEGDEGEVTSPSKPSASASASSSFWTLAAGWQVHGSDVRVVKSLEDARGEPGARGETIYCDALTTDAPGVLVGVKTADCVPVVLGDARTGACAAVHAGWRGTSASIVVRALERMREEYGTRPSDVRAAIGPAANACCYEVGAEVLAALRANLADAESLFTPTREGHARVDLQRANREQLIRAGVSPERVHTLPLCTMCRTDLFFSYRREKALHGRTGRLLSVIGRR